MPIVVTCSACNRQLKVPDNAAGMQVRCPLCQAVFVIPVPGGTAPAPAIPAAPAPPAARPNPPPAAPPPKAPPVRNEPPELALSQKPANSVELFAPIRVSVKVKRDPQRLLQSKSFQADFGPDGLPLLDRHGETVWASVGSPSRYLGGNRLEVTVNGQPVEVTITRLGSYQDRLARDIAEYLQGKRSRLDEPSYRLPASFYPLIGLPPFAAFLLFSKGILPAGVFGALGGLVSWTNFVVLQKERLALALRLAASIASTVLLYGLAILVLILISGGFGGSREWRWTNLQVPEEGFAAEFPGSAAGEDRDRPGMPARVYRVEVPGEKVTFSVEVIDTSKLDLAETQAARRLGIKLDKNAAGKDYEAVMLALMDDLMKEDFGNGTFKPDPDSWSTSGHPLLKYKIAYPGGKTVALEAAMVRRKIYFLTVETTRFPSISQYARKFFESFRLLNPPEPWLRDG